MSTDSAQKAKGTRFMLTFNPVQTDADIEKTAGLAHEIWNEYWPDLIGQDQTTYMVETFQSTSAIKNDIITRGYLYYLVFDADKTLVGYTAAAPEIFDSPTDKLANAHGEEVSKHFLKRLFISKIYLRDDQRGKHYASRIIEFWEAYCRTHGLEGMYLTVNRDNELGIRAYLGRGFSIYEDIAAPIGNGFIMDDHIMGKSLL